MVSREQEIISLIENFCRVSGLAPATVGMRALKDGKIYDRLLKGGSCAPKTHEKAIRWFKENTPKKLNQKLESN